MENERKELFGAWIQASGTTLAAIGSTPLKNFTEGQLTSFNLWGNELQALGNALIADSELYFTMEKIGKHDPVGREYYGGCGHSSSCE
ncbi:DUF6944 family repetitive protein [Mesobacillus selenatarsenatis]|uniref:Uncharacterized protein n=1 Tax=Mesobacillus selenatarsenatis (strain DSM 18680 / JCM 14380 / FERM P-15431 / SF-1) TaxID=1321606 RepID=A0A0A8X4V3_MESS1|nr:hypothetical protein [Mesobacillus selenatarsenatis]GAM14289.1 hypothetical protein SAMD00020551_2438 [Mesobacillus selenatarsenatis SF-1]